MTLSNWEVVNIFVSLLYVLNVLLFKGVDPALMLSLDLMSAGREFNSNVDVETNVFIGRSVALRAS